MGILETRKIGNMTVTRIYPVVWGVAMTLAGNDLTRIVIFPDAIYVCNSPEHAKVFSTKILLAKKALCQSNTPKSYTIFIPTP